MMNEVTVKLKERLKKELEDVLDYDVLYKLLTNEDERFEINSIASDEYRHACRVQSMLEYRGIDIDDELRELWKKASDVWDA